MNDTRLGLPDRRKNTYVQLEKKIDQHMESIEKRLRRFFLKALAAFAVIGIASAVALFGFKLVLSQIQDNREEFVRESCLAQNSRHDNTLSQLRKVSKQAVDRAKTEEEKKQVRQGISSSILLIEALVPKQDCEQLVKVAQGKAKRSSLKKQPETRLRP